MNVIKKLFIAVIIVMAASAAFAQDSMTMKQLRYSIWPEYDKSDVLIIYSGKFVNDTGKPFNGKLAYYIPKGAKINMLCETEKGMLCQRYIVEDAGEYSRVVWRPSRTIAPGEEFPVMFEYYVDYFDETVSQRRFTDILRAPFPVNNLTVEVKKPAGAENFQMNPASQWSQMNGEFENFYVSYQNVSVSEEIPIQVEYTRNNSAPSVQKTAGGNSQVAQTANAASVNNKMIVVVALFFTAMAAVIIFITRKPSNAKNLEISPKTESKKQVKKEKEKIRKMLLDGKISEDTYKQLMKDLGD